MARLSTLFRFALLVGLLMLASAVFADEFVGPFSSWKNVKTDYGAVGNGVADDTTALQNALNAMGAGTFKVLYIPAGTYKITSTLTMITLWSGCKASVCR